MISDKKYKRKLKQWQSNSNFDPQRDLDFVSVPDPFETLFDSTNPKPRNPLSRVLQTEQTLKKAVLECLNNEIPIYAAHGPVKVIGDGVEERIPEQFSKECSYDYEITDCISIKASPRIAVTDSRIIIFACNRWSIRNPQPKSGYFNWEVVVEIPIQEISEVLFRYERRVGNDYGSIRFTHDGAIYCVDSFELGLPLAKFIGKTAELGDDHQVEAEVEMGSNSSQSEYYHLGWGYSERDTSSIEKNQKWKYIQIDPEEALHWDEMDSATEELEEDISDLINTANHINEQYMGETPKNQDERKELESERSELVTKISKLREILYIIEHDEVESARNTAQEIIDQESPKATEKRAGIKASQKAHQEAKTREPPVEIGEVVKFGIIEFTPHHSGKEHAVGRVEGFMLFTMDVPATKEVNDIIEAKILHFDRDKRSATARYVG